MFQPQFHDKVESGEKLQTIRPTPKRMPKVGDYEIWRGWTGKPYRSRQFNLALVQIVSVEPIHLTPEVAICEDLSSPRIFFDVGLLAKEDGFSGWEQMRDWFEKQHGLPFSGILIKAQPTPGKTPASSHGQAATLIKQTGL